MNSSQRETAFPPLHQSVIVSYRLEEDTTQHCAHTSGHLVIFLFVRRRKLFEKSIEIKTCTFKHKK